MPKSKETKRKASSKKGGDKIHVVKTGFVTDRDGPAIHHGPPLLGAHTRQRKKHRT